VKITMTLTRVFLGGVAMLELGWSGCEREGRGTKETLEHDGKVRGLDYGIVSMGTHRSKPITLCTFSLSS
jgi:hypothetical protein